MCVGTHILRVALLLHCLDFTEGDQHQAIKGAARHHLTRQNKTESKNKTAERHPTRRLIRNTVDTKRDSKQTQHHFQQVFVTSEGAVKFKKQRKRKRKSFFASRLKLHRRSGHGHAPAPTSVIVSESGSIQPTDQDANDQDALDSGVDVDATVATLAQDIQPAAGAIIATVAPAGVVAATLPPVAAATAPPVAAATAVPVLATVAPVAATAVPNVGTVAPVIGNAAPVGGSVPGSTPTGLPAAAATPTTAPANSGGGFGIGKLFLILLLLSGIGFAIAVFLKVQWLGRKSLLKKETEKALAPAQSERAEPLMKSATTRFAIASSSDGSSDDEPMHRKCPLGSPPDRKGSDLKMGAQKSTTSTSRKHSPRPSDNQGSTPTHRAKEAAPAEPKAKGSACSASSYRDRRQISKYGAGAQSMPLDRQESSTALTNPDSDEEKIMEGAKSLPSQEKPAPVAEQRTSRLRSAMRSSAARGGSNPDSMQKDETKDKTAPRSSSMPDSVKEEEQAFNCQPSLDSLDSF